MPLEWTPKLIAEAWDAREGERDGMARRQSYFAGIHDILKLRGTKRRDGRPHQIAVMNWIEVIVRRHVGFLAANPFRVTVSDAEDASETATEAYEELRVSSDLDSLDARQITNALIYGHGVEVHSFDGDEIIITDGDPLEWAFVEDERRETVAAIRRLERKKGDVYRGEFLGADTTFWTLYTDTEIVSYQQIGNNDLTEEGREEHFYARSPAFRWLLTEDGSSLVSDALITLQNGYNTTLSSHLEDMATEVDSLLVMTGVSQEALLHRQTEGGPTYYETLREMGVFVAPDKDTSVQFLTRDLPSEKTDFTLRALRRLIHSLGACPDLDEIVGVTGQSSGIALRLQFQPMVERASEAEKYIRASLRRRVDLLNGMWAKLNLDTLENYDVTITVGIPENDVERITGAMQLKDVVSHLDLLRMIPWIDDPQAALDAWEGDQTEAEGQGIPAQGEGAETPSATLARALAGQAGTANKLADLSAAGLADKLQALLGSTAPTLTAAQIRKIVNALLNS